jgi:hypothetical protein
MSRSSVNDDGGGVSANDEKQLFAPTADINTVKTPLQFFRHIVFWQLLAIREFRERVVRLLRPATPPPLPPRHSVTAARATTVH